MSKLEITCFSFYDSHFFPFYFFLDLAIYERQILRDASLGGLYFGGLVVVNFIDMAATWRSWVRIFYRDNIRLFRCDRELLVFCVN